MVEETKAESPNKAVIEFMNSMQEKMEALTKKQTELEKENAELKKTKAGGVKAFVESTSLGRQAKGIINQEPNVVTEPTLKDQPAYIGLEYKKDCCPLCNAEGKKNIVDQTPKNGWQCRVCAKNWQPWSLSGKYPYSLHLEQNDREADYLQAIAREKNFLVQG